MRTSKIVIFASSAIAITALLFGTATLLLTHTDDAATSSGATAPVVSTTLEPVVVVATR